MSMLSTCTRLTCLLSRSLSLCFRLLSRSRLLCLRLPCQRQRSARGRGRGERWKGCEMELFARFAFNRSFSTVWRFSFLDRFAILYRHQLALSVVKRTLGTHLGYAAQSNEDTSERDQSEGSDPPSNSCRHPKRQNLHPYWF